MKINKNPIRLIYKNKKGFELTQEHIDVIKKVALEDFGLQI